jgi:hypothetical protein
MKIILLILSLLLMSACTSSMPTDKEMISHFERNRTAFDRCVALLRQDTLGLYYYPPYSGEQCSAEDSLYFAAMPQEKASTLDSLLRIINVERVFFGRTIWNQSGRDSLAYEFQCRFPYHTVGISISGAAKGYVYHPHIVVDTLSHVYVVSTELDKIHMGNIPNYHLYRPIGNGWYLYYEYDQ